MCLHTRSIIILTPKKGNMMQEKEQLVLSYNFHLFRNGKYNWTVFVYYFFGLPPSPNRILNDTIVKSESKKKNRALW